MSADAERVTLGRSSGRAPPRLARTVAVYRDGDCLVAVFSCTDDGIVATHYEHDAPLWQEDVVELFLAPDRLGEYFEIEVNPLGTVFDARIVSPDGVRATMRADVGWECRGLFAAVRRYDRGEGAFSLDVVVRMPFDAFGSGVPQTGTEWRANFYRIDRSAQGDEFTAWQPTGKTPP